MKLTTICGVPLKHTATLHRGAANAMKDKESAKNSRAKNARDFLKGYSLTGLFSINLSRAFFLSFLPPGAIPKKMCHVTQFLAYVPRDTFLLKNIENFPGHQKFSRHLRPRHLLDFLP
jgi:hypothetical protein